MSDLEFEKIYIGLICKAEKSASALYDSLKGKLDIACTRALHRLNLFCVGKDSRLLSFYRKV